MLILSFRAKYDAFIARKEAKNLLRNQGIYEGELHLAEDKKYQKANFFNGPHPLMDNNQLQVRCHKLVRKCFSYKTVP